MSSKFEDRSSRRSGSGHPRHEPLIWLAIVALLLASAPATAAAASQPDSQVATVTATDALYLRDCPVLTCQIVGTATLGDAVEITGEEVGGYVPVAWQGREGWAYRLFLSVGDEPAELIRSGVPGCNRVALIFNAGIGEAPSEAILNTLTATQAPVTLFAMGWWADTYPDYLSRFARDANAVVGSHGDTQLFLTDATDERIAGEIRDSADSIQQVLGYPPARYYTPYATDSDGRVQRVISREGYLPVAWTISAADYTDAETADGVYSRVMGDASDGAIIEFHLDGPATDESTALALPNIIRDLQAQGYRLVSLPEILLPCPSMP